METTAIIPTRELAARFWSKVRKTRGCWAWRGARGTGGYGLIMLNSRTLKRARAHRVAWALIEGAPVPPMLCHACNNPACVRVHPRHIYAGSHQDNARDRRLAGTSRALRPKQVRALRRRYVQDIAVNASALARELDVSSKVVSDALTGRSWEHVKYPPPIPHLSNRDTRNGRARIDLADDGGVREIAFSVNKHGRRLAWRLVRFDGASCWVKMPLALADQWVSEGGMTVLDFRPRDRDRKEQAA